jgi:hypothetical protein
MTDSFQTLSISWFICHSAICSHASWARPIQSTSCRRTTLRSFLILSNHLHLGLPSRLFPSGFPTNNLYTLLFSLIRATWPAHLILLAKSTNHEATRYVVFTILSSPHPSSVQISSSATCSQTTSVCVLPLMSETKFHTYTEPQAKLCTSTIKYFVL